MKKWLNYILISIFLFIGIDKVDAEMITCYYNTTFNASEYEYTCTFSGDDNISCYMNKNDIGMANVSLKKNDFISNDKVSCPKKIYLEVTAYTTGNSDYAWQYSTSYVASKISTKKISVNGNNSLVTFDLERESIPKLDSENNNVSNDDTSNNDKNYLDSCDELGETGKLIKQIYNLLKYLVPILVVGLSIIDFLKVLLNGEEKVFNEAWSKFIKRLVVGIAIFIIPFILSLLLNISGILDNYGMDNSMKSIFCIFE